MAHRNICVLYHYFEADQSYRENLLHFLVFGHHPDAEFYVIAANRPSFELPIAPNLNYIFTPNHNRDYGGYSVALNGEIRIDRYEYFVFVNSSVRGPYLPAYTLRSWFEILVDQLVDDVGLAGSTINILSPAYPYTAEFKQRHGGEPPFSHVQSTVFAICRDRLLELMNSGLFEAGREALQKTHVITDYELLISQKLIRAGYNIKCLLPEYNTVDYRAPHTDINPTSVNGDPSYEGAYFGRTFHPFEAMFIKTNRNLYPPHFLDKLTYSMIQRRSRADLDRLAPSLRDYVAEKAVGTRFDLPMPSLGDQVAQAKLTEIVQSINSILTKQN